MCCVKVALACQSGDGRRSKEETSVCYTKNTYDIIHFLRFHVDSYLQDCWLKDRPLSLNSSFHVNCHSNGACWLSIVKFYKTWVCIQRFYFRDAAMLTTSNWGDFCCAKRAKRLALASFCQQTAMRNENNCCHSLIRIFKREREM